MPRDAKLGLIIGVGLVILIAVIFFRKEDGPGGTPAAVAAESARTQPVPLSEVATPAASSGPVYRHVVQEGDTLYSLARRYYNDDAKFVDIYQVNRNVLTRPDELTPGTVLVLPGVRAE
jgi:nucleoid-associated protein YgaU